MKFLKILFFFSLLAAPTGLQAQKNSDATPTVMVVPPQEALQNFNRTFTGTIDNKLQIVMRLWHDSTRLWGWYYYSRGEKFYKMQSSPLYIEGKIENGQFVMNEFDENGVKSGLLKGSIGHPPGYSNPPYEIFGTWQKDSASPKKVLRLKQQFFWLGDSTALVESDLVEETWLYNVNIIKPGITRGFKTENLSKAIDEIIIPILENFKNEAQNVDVTDSATREILNNSKSGLDVNYDVMYADSNLVSLRFVISEYEAGAAHPMNYSNTLNFDLKAGKVLKTDDIFKNEKEFLKTASSVARRELLKKGVSDKEWINTGTEPTIENFQNWSITKKGILLTFDQYQVASYAAGPQEVLLPYSAVKGLLKKGSAVEMFLK